VSGAEARPHERGVILLVVLYAMALLAAAALAIGFTARGETTAARNALDGAAARHAAEAGVQLGLRRLLARAARNDLSLPLSETVRVGAARVTLSLADEEGKIDLNEAPLELVAGAFAAAGLPPGAAGDAACEVVARRGGAGAGCPQASGPVRRFDAVEELYATAGGDIGFWALLPLVTVYSGSAAIDPRVAPPGALAAVPSLRPEDVDAFVRRRTEAAEAKLPLDEAEVPRDRRWFAASSRQTYAVRGAAVTDRGARSTAEMVVRLTGQPRRPFVVVAWRQPRGG